MKLVKVDKYYDSRQVCVDATVAEAEKTFATNIFQSADDKMYANILRPRRLVSSTLGGLCRHTAQEVRGFSGWA